MRPHLTSLALLFSLGSPAAWADHIAREDPPEPIFTERSFIENDVELDVNADRDRDADSWEFSPGVTWIFFERLQLGFEIPLGWRIPESGSQQVALSDVDFSAKWLFCCERHMGFTYVSARVDVAPPSGNRAKGIGGTGGFSFSLLGGYGLTLVDALEDLAIQGQLAWEQELRAAAPGSEAEKGVLWNLAFSQPLFGARVVPTFEILGTSVVDADDPGTRLDLAAGFQLRPFPDDHWTSPISVSAGWRFPVANRGDFRGAGALSIEWAFD